MLGSKIALLYDKLKALYTVLPQQGYLALVTLPIAAMQGAEASIPYSWVPIFSIGWREAPRMLSHVKQLASVGIKPTTLGLLVQHPTN